MTANSHFQRIGIIGAGAMGAGLAALIGERTNVVLVCRNPDRAATIIRDGVRSTGLITGAASPLIVRRISDLASFNDLDLIFVATKTNAIPSVADELAPTLRRLDMRPYIVSYQNGIEPGRELMERLGSPRVVRIVLNLGMVLDPDTGHARVTFDSPPHAIGCVDPELRPACERIAALLTEAGLRTAVVPDIERHVWLKGVLNAATNPITALINGSVGRALDAPCRVILLRLLEEGAAVAQAEGFDLGDDFVAEGLRRLEEARDHVPSMVEDIRNNRETEIGQLNEQIIAHARRCGVPTPTHEMIDALITTFGWHAGEESGPPAHADAADLIHRAPGKAAR